MQEAALLIRRHVTHLYAMQSGLPAGVCRGELYPCETEVRLCDELETDEEVEVDMDTDVLTVLRTGKQYALKPIGDVSSP